MKKLLGSALVAVAGASAFAEGETGTVTLPSTGVDVGAYANQGIATLGGVVAVCVGGTIAFMIIRWGIRWVRGIGR